jgi:hypothetical protein
MSKIDNDKLKKLLKIVEIAVEHSDGQLRIVTKNEKGNDPAHHYVELEGQCIEHSIESYAWMGETRCWDDALTYFFVLVILPLKRKAPQSFEKACEETLLFAELIFPKEKHASWKKLLYG